MSNLNEITVDGDERAKLLCIKIAQEMMKEFGISMPEAIGRVNREWKNKRIFGPNQVYRENLEYWAKRIYYKPGTYWWVEKWLAEHIPEPKPYP